MNLAEITPLILTCNEQPNIGRALEGVQWSSQIVIIDSGSSDGTREIAAADCRVRVYYRDFDNHTNQWNYGLSEVRTPWVLTLDADYFCPKGIEDELRELSPVSDAYFVTFTYCIYGAKLSNAMYPPRAVLFRTDRLRYVPDGHTQLLDLQGVSSGILATKILHDDRKPLSRWCASQVKYAELEADKLLSTDIALLEWKDLLRKKIVIAPILTLGYCLFVKRLIFDGWVGVFYSFQRVFAELLLSLVLLERTLNPGKKNCR